MLGGTVSCTWMLLATATTLQLVSCRNSKVEKSIFKLTSREVKEIPQEFLAMGMTPQLKY